MMLELCLVSQICVTGKLRRGLSIHSCGAPVFRGSVEEGVGVGTIWKSIIKLHMLMLRPRFLSFMISLAGIMVFNAEL